MHKAIIIFFGTAIFIAAHSAPDLSSLEEIEEICHALITHHLSQFIRLTFTVLRDQPHNVNETTFRSLFALILAKNGMEAKSVPFGECTLATKTKQTHFIVEFRVNKTAHEAMISLETYTNELMNTHGKDTLCMGINYVHDISDGVRERLICDWVASLYSENATLRKSFPPRKLIYWKPLDVKPEPFNDYYETFEILGEGVSSRVIRCLEKDTKKIFAAKVIRSPIKHTENRERIRREIHIMNQLHHPNLLTLHDVFENDENIILVVEFLSGGELNEQGILSEFETIKCVKQICNAVKYLHERNIFHLDLTRDNIMCRTERCTEIVLIDFGESIENDLVLKKVQHSLTDSSERCKFTQPKRTFVDLVKVQDMLSIGAITGILLTGEYPPTQSNELRNFLGNISISDTGKDFIKRLLPLNKGRPMTIYETLNHPWLSGG